MMVKAIIVEQLENDGTMRTLRMQPDYGKEMVVAFADEYEDPRSGPFHFLDEQYDDHYSKGFADCKARQIGTRRYYKTGDNYHVELSWEGIPTERGSLSYYALSLPEYAVPASLSMWDPHMPDRQYQRTILRDDIRHRYIIYLKCSSSRGSFDFDFSCDFRLDHQNFYRSEYHDAKTTEYGNDGGDWKYLVSNEEEQKVIQFFVGQFVHEGKRIMKNTFNAPVGVVAESARDFTQVQNLGQNNSFDLKILVTELGKLRAESRQEATEAEHDVAIGEIAQAESAAKKGDEQTMLQHLSKAGSWAFEVATKIGTTVAAEAIKQSLNMGAGPH